MVVEAPIQRPVAGGRRLADREQPQRAQRTQMEEGIEKLCALVRETAYAIHVYHGHGHLEKVYENALAHRLRKAGVHVLQQQPIRVLDEDGTELGFFVADLLVAGSLVLEVKAAKSLADEHIAQILGYLKSARMEHGLLINFGCYKFQIRKFIMTSKAQSESTVPDEPIRLY
jgi:GxxExxY protein